MEHTQLEPSLVHKVLVLLQVHVGLHAEVAIQALAPNLHSPDALNLQLAQELDVPISQMFPATVGAVAVDKLGSIHPSTQ